MVELARTSAESAQPPNAPWRPTRRNQAANGIRLAGQLSLVEHALSEVRLLGGRDEQEFRQAKEAAEAEAPEDAQATPQREARGQEIRLRPPSAGRQVGASKVDRLAGLNASRRGGACESRGSECVEPSKGADVLRKPLTLVAQPPEFSQLDLAQGRPTTEEERHTIVTIAPCFAELGRVEH